MTEDQRQLVEDHAYLVGWHMARLKRRGLHLPPDAESDGQWGLVLAAKQFKPELGFQFSTLAGRYIIGGLLRHKRKRRRPILGTDLEHVPSRDQEEPSGTDAGDLIRRAIRLIDDPRSKQVAEMIATGKTQEQIGRKLGVSDWETRMVIDRVRSWLSQILTGVPLRHYPSRKAATNQPMLPGMVDV